MAYDELAEAPPYAEPATDAPAYASYADFDNLTGFSRKAGFQLSALQISDVEQFRQWRASLNRYEVGGGKTVVSTVVSLMRPEVTTTIVTVPPILLRPWVRWLTLVSERVLSYEGDPRERAKLHKLMAGSRWIVCSHDIFRRDFPTLVQQLNGRDIEIIVDEAQFLKNAASVLFKKVLALAATEYVQLLTGTPTSKPLDCYSYIKIKSPNLYRSLTHFESLHVGKRDFYQRPVEWINLEELAQNFGIQSIRRTKEELHGYNNPPLYPDCTYNLSRPHMQLYEKLVDEQLLMLDNGTKIDATSAQRLYHASQQIVVNFDHFSGDPNNRSASYDLLDSVIEQTECNNKGKSKLIVWTHYKRTSRAVWQYLLGLGIKTVAAYSEVKSQDSFDMFMEDEDTRILVGQT